MIIKGFSRYDSTVQSLPILENYPPCRDGRLHRRKLLARVLRIGSVKIIGRADFDAQRGRAFEQSISVTRAQEVERELRTRVDRLTWDFDPTVNPKDRTPLEYDRLAKQRRRRHPARCRERESAPHGT